MSRVSNNAEGVIAVLPPILKTALGIPPKSCLDEEAESKINSAKKF